MDWRIAAETIVQVLKAHMERQQEVFKEGTQRRKRGGGTGGEWER